MLQKKKKKNRETLYLESLAADIEVAKTEGKNCVYEPAIGEEEKWLWRFVENNNYKCYPSHNTDKVQYWKIKF